MSRIQEELKITLQLLKKEWKEDLEQYRAKTLSASVADKQKEGICWYPVQLVKTKVGLGDRLIVEVERADTRLSHGFQSGKTVSLFSNFSDGAPLRTNGVVNMVKKNTMVVTLMGHEWPDWLHDGKLGVDLHFDEASYREMEYAVQQVIKAGEGRLGQLRNVLLGQEKASFVRGLPKSVEAPHLNHSQVEAVEMVLAAQEVALVHGPPGTGKTTTMVQAIEETLRSQDRKSVV